MCRNCLLYTSILAYGIDFKKLPVGTKLICNDAKFEITQIGKECHSHCEIYKRVGAVSYTHLKQQWIENIPCISIGEKTTKQLREIGVRHILESKDTTYVSMFYKIKESML